MMPFDTYVDTKAKRYYAFGLFILIMMLVLWLAYLGLGLRLVCLNTYEDVFRLLESPIVEQTYLSRFIINLLSSDYLASAQLLDALLSAMRLGEVILILFWLSLGMGRSFQKLFRWQLACLTIWLAVIIVAAVMALSSQTLMQAVQWLRLIGGITLLAYGIIMLLQCFILHREWRSYRQALNVRVVEIRETMRE